MIRLRHIVPLFVTVLSVQAEKYDEMDYGSLLSASFNDTFTVEKNDKGKDKEIEGKNAINGADRIACNKGIAIKLGATGEGAMVFDTDTLRMTGAWTGGFLKYRGVAFDGGHGPNSTAPLNSIIYFGTKPGTPGWSKGDDFKDPRPLPTGPGAATVPLGPLPKDWAKYRGLYRNGEKAVLAYTVGAAGVMESPSLEKVGDTKLIARTFNIVGAGAGSSVVLAEGAEGAEAKVEGGVAVVGNDPKNADSKAIIGVVGAPSGAQLQARGSIVFLKIPALAAGQNFKVVYGNGTAGDIPKILDAIKNSAKAGDLGVFKNGGAAQWPQTLTTKGSLGSASGAYTVDTLTIPFDNPWKSWMRLAGLDFFKDGKRAAVTTWSGDVWIVSGIDDKLENLTWKRFAAGLFQPLGLKIVDDKILVLGRDQITRLSDLNGDNEADWYENFNNDIQVTPGFHEFAFDLQTDPQGNFYFSKGGPVNPGGRGWGPLSDHHGCILKVSKDGSKFEVFATGVRAPNGICVGPNGEVTTGDNQGTWVPACYVHLVQPGEFVGVVDLGHRDPLPTDYSRYITFLPMDVDNSGGGQVFVTSDKWGALKGSLLHCTYGKSGLLAILQEKVGNVIQGGAYRMPIKFDSGVMRPRFNPVDGQLYVVGLKGWQTNAAKDGAFQRVRYTGKTPTLPNELRVTDKGIHIGFTAALNPEDAADVESYSIEQWNYRWSKEYGSLDYKVSNPEEKGRDPVEIKGVKVSSDKKQVFLEIPNLKPVMQMQITMNLKGADGSEVPGKIVNTINAIGKE